MADYKKTYELEFNGYWREPTVNGLPSSSGIYCVYACTYNQDEGKVSIAKLLYVGESADVRKRVVGHPSLEIWKKQLKSGQVLCFSAATIAPDSDRERAEAAMIFKLQPPCNSSCKDSFTYDTTTIESSGRNRFLPASFTVKKET